MQRGALLLYCDALLTEWIHSAAHSLQEEPSEGDGAAGQIWSVHPGHYWGGLPPIHIHFLLPLLHSGCWSLSLLSVFGRRQCDTLDDLVTSLSQGHIRQATVHTRTNPTATLESPVAWRTPENPERTYTDTGRIWKLHTEIIQLHQQKPSS